MKTLCMDTAHKNLIVALYENDRMICGIARNVPMNELIADSAEIAERDRILPTTSSPRRMGVTSSVAMVPRSFSPAMDSGAMPMQPLYRKVRMRKGRSIAYIDASASESVTSDPPAE